MNKEKKIAQAIMDAQKMSQESYCEKEERCLIDIEDCLVATCKEQGLSPNLWALLGLAMHWWNDIQLWAEDSLAGKVLTIEKDKDKVVEEDVSHD